MSRDTILEQFSIFQIGEAGIGAWLTTQTDQTVFDRLDRLSESSLSCTQLNQLLALSHEAPVTPDFFDYYWLTLPTDHPYSIGALPRFEPGWKNQSAIVSLDHLFWGLYRLYVDGLLYFGNVRTAFRSLRAMSAAALRGFFAKRRTDFDYMKSRGPALSMRMISQDDRYLISEMACKSYGESTSDSDLKEMLVGAMRQHLGHGGSSVSVRKLIEAARLGTKFEGRQAEFLFSADDVLEETVATEEDLLEKIDGIASRFHRARTDALVNSRFYLSMVNDLDVYVATSMRTRDDFRRVAKDCDVLFADHRLINLNVRYFDPTLSAASGHEDKGIIECLMVKCAKALVFCAGDKDSYGKDAEAAMALSQGKPVIFYCDQKARSRFYKEVHPLSRLIEFETGVPVGAIVTDKLTEVSEILFRVFTNTMEYEIERNSHGNLRLLDKLTRSVVRLQIEDQLLSETFWNHYHNKRSTTSVD